MPNYNTSHYDPPAPVAHVTLLGTNGGALLPNVLLLLDTGADTPYSTAARIIAK